MASRLPRLKFNRRKNIWLLREQNETKRDNDFGIPGAPVDPETCRFAYAQTSQLLSHIGLGESGGDGRLSKTSQSHDSSWTNSPNYPNNYPANVMCIYVYVPKQGTEYIRLSFGRFDTQQNDQPLARNPCDQVVVESVGPHAIGLKVDTVVGHDLNNHNHWCVWSMEDSANYSRLEPFRSNF
ncbi:unnamed protein product [Calicophoron daubneyi]|uniref:CUB domain-containing protein n=1 Tax=Calicophoron daubneyi TaxID=300641 RepID=A0AAV2TIK2_CALDB